MKPTTPPWPKLIAYYRACLDREQMARLKVSRQSPDAAVLPGMADALIREAKAEALITDPLHVQPLRQLAKRAAAAGDRLLYYAFPVAEDGSSLVPVCYTEVRISEPVVGQIRLERVGELLVNRRFLTEEADLTEAEIAALARQLTVDAYIPADRLTGDAMLFAAEPDLFTRNLAQELKRIGEKRPAELSEPLRAILGAAPSAFGTAPLPGATVVPSNPAQEQVVRRRSSTLQVVTGPPGTGKTQTIINLIASAVCDGQSVLFVSRNNTAVDNVYDLFARENLFPGILRLGNRDVQMRAFERIGEVIASLRTQPPAPADADALTQQSFELSQRIHALEEELAEIRRLNAYANEMLALLRRTDEELRATDLYRRGLEVASQVTAEDAARFDPHQLVKLRLLVARASRWTEADRSPWIALLDRLGLLSWHLRRQFARVGLPAYCNLDGKSLHVQVDALLRFERIFPLVLATARHLHANTELSRRRSDESVKGDLRITYEEKVRVDRERLKAVWAATIAKHGARLSTLGQLTDLAAQTPPGETSMDLWRQWRSSFPAVQALFPVFCCTNLSVANAAPLEPGIFDLVILDEASQSDIPSFLPAMYRGRRACVVGDHQQLRHISQLGEEEDERLRKAQGLQEHTPLSYHLRSAFDRALEVVGPQRAILLDRHYRCVPEIITFCNHRFYGGRLQVERSSLQQLRVGEHPAAGFLLDDLPEGATRYLTTAGSRSAANEAEAERVVWLARQYIQAGITDIGIVTPFKSQRRILEQALRRAGLKDVEVGTIHTFQGGQHQLMLFSTVVAPGAKAGTIRWFEENQNLLNVAISRARDLLIVVGHRATLEGAGGILQELVRYADALRRPTDTLPPLPPGVLPERYGLRPEEAGVLREWLNPPGAAEVMNPGERELFARLQQLVAGLPVLLAPKMRILDALELGALPGVTATERDYAFRGHFDVVLVDLRTFRPLAAVELDGRTHADDPVVQARDRMKNSLCQQARLPLLRVKFGEWDSLAGLRTYLPAPAR